MRENEYQAQVIKKLQTSFPEALIVKNDPNYLQGILDLTIMVRNKYAMLEVKASEKSRERPNQRYYFDLINSRGGHAFFIYPENEEEVFNALQQALGS